MTDDDWKVCKQALFRTFPSLAAWADALDPPASAIGDRSRAGREAMDRRWRGSLGRETLQDALQAIEKASLAPESPWPFPSDYERAGAILAGICRDGRPRNRYNDLDPLAMGGRRPGAKYRSDGTYAKVIDRIRTDTRHSPECVDYRQATGRCHRDCPVPSFVAAEILEEPCGLPEDGTRCKCWACRDSGYVSCLRAHVVKAVIETRRNPLLNSGTTFAVRCTCSTGQNLMRVGEYPDFDENTMVVARQSLRDLVGACLAAVDNAVNLTHKRNAGFDSFNQGEV